MRTVFKTFLKAGPLREIALIYFGRPLLAKIWTRLSTALEEESQAVKSSHQEKQNASATVSSSAPVKAAPKPVAAEPDSDADRLLH